jgi:hypothetical protein
VVKKNKGGKELQRKGEHVMWDFINIQNGLALAALDFTNDFALLGIGLVGVIWSSVGVLILMAIEHARSQATLLKSEETPTCPEHREAA